MRLSNTPLKPDRFAPKIVRIFEICAVARGGLAASRWTASSTDTFSDWISFVNHDGMLSLRTFQQIAILGLSLVLGYLGTWGAAYIDSLELLHTWQPIPNIPSGTIDTVMIWSTTLYVTTGDGMVFAIDPATEMTWHRVASVPQENLPTTERLSLGACDLTNSRFRWYAHPPREREACLESVSLMSVAYVVLSVSRDSQDRLWFFQSGPGSDFEVSGLLLAITLFIVFSFYSFLLLLWLFTSERLRKRRRTVIKDG